MCVCVCVCVYTNIFYLSLKFLQHFILITKIYLFSIKSLQFILTWFLIYLLQFACSRTFNFPLNLPALNYRPIF